MTLSTYSYKTRIPNDQSQAQKAVRLADDEGCIGQEPDLIDAEEVGAFIGDGDGAGFGSAIIKGVAVLAQSHVGKGKGEIVILSRVLTIDERIVGELKQDDEMPVAAPLGPDAILLHSIRKRLRMVGAGNAPIMRGIGEGARGAAKPRANDEGPGLNKSFHGANLIQDVTDIHLMAAVGVGRARRRMHRRIVRADGFENDGDNPSRMENAHGRVGQRLD